VVYVIPQIQLSLDTLIMRYTDEGRAQWELAHIAEAKESVEAKRRTLRDPIWANWLRRLRYTDNQSAFASPSCHFTHLVPLATRSIGAFRLGRFVVPPNSGH